LQFYSGLSTSMHFHPTIHSPVCPVQSTHHTNPKTANAQQPPYCTALKYGTVHGTHTMARYNIYSTLYCHHMFVAANHEKKYVIRDTMSCSCTSSALMYTHSTVNVSNRSVT
jgi:hypothetical protein